MRALEVMVLPMVLLIFASQPNLVVESRALFSLHQNCHRQSLQDLISN